MELLLRGIGELSAELEKVKAGRPPKKGKSVPPAEPISKADALKAAGISKGQASRAERVAHRKVVSRDLCKSG
jgi:hypothetical protein